MPLADYQHSIDGFVFGAGTACQIDRVTGLGLGPKETRVFRNPGADGVAFGREYRNGKNIVYEGHIQINTGTATERASAALNAVEALQAAWDNPVIRTTPRATSTLRIKWPGRAEKVIPGRPGSFDWDPQAVAQGRILWSATFDAT